MNAAVAMNVANVERPSTRQHGTRTKYMHDRCRCDACRAANNAYESRRTRRTSPYRLRCVTAARWWLVQKRSTNETILKTRDREEAVRVCAEVNAELDTNEPLWASRGILGFVRRHLRTLRAHGLGLHRVAEVTGISRTRLMEILNDKSFNRDRPRHRRLKMATAERIIAVTILTPVADGAIVPAAETWRLIEELRAFGIPKARIAKAMGAKTPALQLRHDRVIGRSARKIRELHDRAREKSEAFRAEHCRCPEER